MSRILVVEDEAVVALDIQERLSRLGHEVVATADSYVAALEQANALYPDLVLMDVALRDGPDGIEAAERLRSQLPVPVVFLTAFADAATLERAKRASPHGYIIKPFDERDLRAAIEIALHRDGLERALRRSHDDLLAMLDVQRTGNVLVDAAGRVVFANTTAARILSVEAGTLVGVSWPEALGLAGDAQRGIEVGLRAPRAERRKMVVSLEHRQPACVVEIEIEDDPRTPERRILLLTDVTDLHVLRRILNDQARFHDLIGRHEAMQRVARLVRQVAPVDVTVIVEGETGTGKELVARAIHQESGRRDGPFVAVNCAGLSEELAASQLFGHRRGAFTGAVQDAAGMFEAARAGTLFLDEIGELPPRVQTTFLRVLEERAVMRVGETHLRPVDVRIVAATNRDLAREVAEGRFRADLLYRLRIGRITLPPLRDRLDDLPLLVFHILAEQRAIASRAVDGVSDEALQAMLAYDWPGNVRELKHAIGYAVIHAPGSTIELEDLPPEILAQRNAGPSCGRATGGRTRADRRGARAHGRRP